MFSLLEIENFQSHKSTKLELVPGTNVLIGPSDSGKSAILRALYWLLFNRPLGDAFRSEWGGDTKVVLHTTDGNVIERIRTASRNEYVLDGSVMAAFGADVPEDVARALKMDQYNFQSQMDAPFLLAASPGDAARQLNEAANINDIDTTTSSLRKSLNALRNRIALNEERLAEQQEELAKYDYLPAVEEQLVRLEELISNHAQQQDTYTHLSTIVDRARELEEELERTEHIPTLMTTCLQLEKQVMKYRSGLSRYSHLATIVVQCREIVTYLDSVKHVEDVAQELREVEEQIHNAKNVLQRRDSLSSVLKRAQDVQAQLESLSQELTSLEEEYHQACPEICPLCGSKIR